MQFSFGEFSKLNISLQSIIIGTVLIMPFFYLDIFIYNRSFFLLNPIYLSVILSYVLTISWLSAIIFFYFTLDVALSISGKTIINKTFPLSIFTAVIGIAATNAIIYALPCKTTFKEFILMLSCIAIACSVLSFISLLISETIRNKKNKQLKIEFKD